MKVWQVILISILLIAVAMYLVVLERLKSIKYDFQLLQYTLPSNSRDANIVQAYDVATEPTIIDILVSVFAPFTINLKAVKVSIYYKDKLILKQVKQNGFDIEIPKNINAEITESFSFQPSVEALELFSRYFNFEEIQVIIKVSSMIFGFPYTMSKNIELKKKTL